MKQKLDSKWSSPIVMVIDASPELGSDIAVWGNAGKKRGTPDVRQAHRMSFALFLGWQEALVGLGM